MKHLTMSPRETSNTAPSARVCAIPENERPFFSVHMPSHNRREYLSLAIEGILAQTFQDFELLIIDDSDDPETIALVKKYAEHPKIHVFWSAPTTEITLLRNGLIRESAGKWMVIADDDDISDPRRLEIVKAAIERADAEGEPFDMFQAKADFMDAEGRPVAHSYNWTVSYTDPKTKKRISVPSHTGTVAIRMAALRDPRIDGYIENWNEVGNGFGNDLMTIKGFRLGEDNDLYVRILEAGFAYHYEPVVVTCYRLHGGQTVSTPRATAKNKSISASPSTQTHTRVLWFVPRYPPKTGGAEFYTHTVARELAERGFVVSVVTDESIPDNEGREIDGVTAYHASKREAASWVDRLAPHIIIAQFGWTNTAYDAGRSKNIPVMSVCHNDTAFWKETVRKDVLTGLHGWIAVSTTAAAAIRTEVERANISLLCPTIDMARVLITPEIQGAHKREKITLINCTPYKGIHTLVEVAKAMPGRSFLGRSCGDCKQIIPTLPNFTHEPTGDIRTALAQTRILFVGSHIESWGLAGLEAQANGIPVVASTTEGLREALQNSALFADPNDPQEFIKRIGALDNPATYEKYVAAGKANVERVQSLHVEQLAGVVAQIKNIIAINSRGAGLQPWEIKDLAKVNKSDNLAKPNLIAKKHANYEVQFSFNVLSHNRGQLLKQAVDSMLAQTLPLFEIVIADDSTDAETRLILDAYRDNPKIRILDFAPTKEMTWLRNAMLLMSRGKYIVYNDDDDLSEPTRLMMTRNVLEAYKADLVCLGVDVINANGKRIKQSALRPMDFYDTKGAKQRIMIHTAGAAFNREKAICAGGYDLNWNRKDNPHYPLIDGRRIGDDFDFFKRFLQAGNKYYQKNFLGAHLRRHEGNITKSVKWFDIPDRDKR